MAIALHDINTAGVLSFVGSETILGFGIILFPIFGQATLMGLWPSYKYYYAILAYCLLQLCAISEMIFGACIVAGIGCKFWFYRSND